MGLSRDVDFAEHHGFAAGAVTAWSRDAEALPWERARELLETLLALGVIERLAHGTAPQ